MQYVLTPSKEVYSVNRHSVSLPGSKSISNRALILDALAYGNGAIEGLAVCDDTDVMVKVLSSNDADFNIGAAGTAMRFLTAYLSKIGGCWTISGTERMHNRPIGVLVEALNSLGAKIEYVNKEGFPPLRIRGCALEGGDLTLFGGVSSQFVSALLMLAPTMRRGLRLTLTGEIVSRPYIEMTLGMMNLFGVKSRWEGSVVTVEPQSYSSVAYCVEADWSAASYFYQLVALSQQGSLLLKGLTDDSLQGDAEIADVFQRLGVETAFTAEGALIRRTDTIPDRFDYDFSNQPDVAQTFAVCCCMMNVPFTLRGLKTLRIKETDRIAALINETRKLGFVLKETLPNTLSWDGERGDQDELPVIQTYEDHRMAMAFAPAALRMDQLAIDEPGVVSKSFPAFWDELCKLGFGIESRG